MKINSSQMKQKDRFKVNYLATILVLLLIVRCYSLLLLIKTQFVEFPIYLLSKGLIMDFCFGLLSWVLFILLSQFKSQIWKKVFFTFIGFFIIFELSSNFYFLFSLNSLDHTLYQFSIADLLNIINIYGDFHWYYLLLIFPIPLVFLLYKFLNRKPKLSYAILFFVIVIMILPLFYEKPQLLDFEKRFTKNKTLFFITDSYSYFSHPSQDKALQISKYIFTSYPLLHKERKENPLGPFLKLKEQPPNIVFIIAESLSAAFSGPKAEGISLTPYLDSLAKHSLYFNNFLSTAERTFGVLPSSFGSLPHGETGFLKMDLNMPDHESILSILVDNGYNASFYYGGDANYDNMRVFMENNGVQSVFDHSKEYNVSVSKWSDQKSAYGVEDQNMFRKASDNWKHPLDTPFIHTYLTLSTHQPFKVENQKKYENIAKELIVKQAAKKGLNKNRFLKSTQVFSTFVYLDYAIKNLINHYSKDPAFENTIFFIYGDHMLGPFPKKNSLEKYRVPLFIYSPLLKRSKSIEAINSHLDLPPSILSLLKSRYPLKSPQFLSWLGEPFDTSENVNRNRQLSFMLNSRDRVDFLAHDFYLSKGKLYRIDDMLNTHLILNKKKLDSIKNIEDSMVFVQNWVLNNNQLVKRKKPATILSQKELAQLPIFENETEYTDLFSYIFKQEETAILADINLTFKQKIPISKPYKRAPSVVLTIKDKDGGRVFWEQIGYQYPNDSNIYHMHTSRYIKANSKLPLTEGSEFKVYFWRNKQSDTNFVLTHGEIKLSAIIE